VAFLAGEPQLEADIRARVLTALGERKAAGATVERPAAERPAVKEEDDVIEA